MKNNILTAAVVRHVARACILWVMEFKVVPRNEAKDGRSSAETYAIQSLFASK
jgi:hypothetical protein